MKEQPMESRAQRIRKEIHIDRVNATPSRITAQVGSASVIFAPEGDWVRVVGEPSKEISQEHLQEAKIIVNEIFKERKEKELKNKLREKERNEILTEADKQRIADEMEESARELAEERRDELLPKEE